MNKLLLKLFCLFICFSVSINVFGQKDFQHQKDSLKKVIKNSEGEEKLHAYGILHSLYMDCVADDATFNAFLNVAEEYEKYAQKIDHIKAQGDIKINYLIACMQIERFDDVEKHAPKILEFLKKNNRTEGYYVAYKQLIIAYCNQALFEKALNELQTVYKDAQQQKDNEAQFYMQYLMGMVYMYQDRLGEAENYYRTSIKIGKEMKPKPFGYLGAYLELCNMLQATGQFDAFFATMKQLEALIEDAERETPNKSFVRWKVNSWILSANAYCAAGEYDKAEYYCDQVENTIGLDGNILNFRALIWDSRKEYSKALDFIDQAIHFDPANLSLRHTKIKILMHIEKAPLSWAETEATIALTDSLRTIGFNAQLDELRTQYEVDKHIAEKERNRNYFLFTLGVCALLIIALGIWIYQNRKITKKNRTLAQQIKELTALQEAQDNELLAKTTFIPEEERTETPDDELCPKSRLDKLCLAIRDLILKDKIYRNPAITQELVIESLGTNRRTFSETFEYCFKMQFKDYISFLRTKDAIILLQQSDLSIEEIADTVGFGTVRTFQRQFNAKYNMSPKEYRKIMSDVN